MYTVEVNAETRTPQGIPISTFYKSTRQETVAAAHAWVAKIDRALHSQFTRAHVTIRTEAGAIYQHYHWVPTGPRRPYCPSKRRKYR